jgi:hypothetical protein
MIGARGGGWPVRRVAGFNHPLRTSSVSLGSRINESRPARGRSEFGHDPVAVGHEDGFSAARQADVLAKLVLQRLDADGAHGGTSSYQQLLCQYGGLGPASSAQLGAWGAERFAAGDARQT